MKLNVQSNPVRTQRRINVPTTSSKRFGRGIHIETTSCLSRERCHDILILFLAFPEFVLTLATVLVAKLSSMHICEQNYSNMQLVSDGHCLLIDSLIYLLTS